MKLKIRTSKAPKSSIWGKPQGMSAYGYVGFGVWCVHTASHGGYVMIDPERHGVEFPENMIDPWIVRCGKRIYFEEDCAFALLELWAHKNCKALWYGLMQQYRPDYMSTDELTRGAFELEHLKMLRWTLAYYFPHLFKYGASPEVGWFASPLDDQAGSLCWDKDPLVAAARALGKLEIVGVK